jgi:hypothetical protein
MRASNRSATAPRSTRTSAQPPLTANSRRSLPPTATWTIQPFDGPYITCGNATRSTAPSRSRSYAVGRGSWSGSPSPLGAAPVSPRSSSGIVSISAFARSIGAASAASAAALPFDGANAMPTSRPLEAPPPPRAEDGPPHAAAAIEAVIEAVIEAKASACITGRYSIGELTGGAPY